MLPLTSFRRVWEFWNHITDCFSATKTFHKHIRCEPCERARCAADREHEQSIQRVWCCAAAAAPGWQLEQCVWHCSECIEHHPSNWVHFWRAKRSTSHQRIKPEWIHNNSTVPSWWHGFHVGSPSSKHVVDVQFISTTVWCSTRWGCFEYFYIQSVWLVRTIASTCWPLDLQAFRLLRGSGFWRLHERHRCFLSTCFESGRLWFIRDKRIEPGASTKHQPQPQSQYSRGPNTGRRGCHSPRTAEQSIPSQ